MRQVVLDTETTGLEAAQGHRIIEIGCIEIVNRRPTGRSFHRYLNPERAVDEGARAVHGLSDEFLADKPRFAEVADEFLDFVSGAELLIHNAAFDEGFLDAELGRLGRAKLRAFCPEVRDTLRMARELFPGKRNSLDSLCERHGISNAHRTLHGALLDAQLLAEVYLAMTRGQEGFELGLDLETRADGESAGAWPPQGLVVLQACEAELAAHDGLLERLAKEIKRDPLFRQAPATVE